MPMYTHIPCVYIHKNIETFYAWNIENRPYNFFFKLLYEDFLWVMIYDNCTISLKIAQ